MAIRLSIDAIMKPILEKSERLWPIAVLFFLAVIPTYFVTEYGTLAFITAMFGYMVKRRGDGFSDSQITAMMIFVIFSYVTMSQLSFAFNSPQALVVMTGTTMICLFLRVFDGRKTYPNLSRALSPYFTNFLTFTGRNTLEIYVIHLIMFKLACMLVQFDERFSWFRFDWL